MKLNEVFEQAYPWKWTEQLETGWSGTFTPEDDTNIDVEFGYDGDGQWEVDFAREADQRGFYRDKVFSAKVTGQGDAFRIYATIMEMIQEFLIAEKPDALVFTAHEASRRKLYKRILPRLAKAVGMNYRIQAAGGDPNRKFRPDLFYLLKNK